MPERSKKIYCCITVIYLVLTLLGFKPLSAAAEQSSDLESRVSVLEKEVAQLKKELDTLRKASIRTTTGDFGSTTPEPVIVDGKIETRIQRAQLDAALTNLPRVLSQVRAVPYFRDGKAVGFRLFAIKPGSYYDHAGLRNGDIIRKINGKPAGEQMNIIEIIKTPPEQKVKTIQIERARKTLELVIYFD